MQNCKFQLNIIQKRFRRKLLKKTSILTRFHSKSRLNLKESLWIQKKFSFDVKIIYIHLEIEKLLTYLQKTVRSSLNIRKPDTYTQQKKIFI